MEQAQIQPAPPVVVIQRFTAISCGVCKAMKKALTLEKWAAAHPNVRLEEYDLDNPLAEAKADELDVRNIPAFVVLDSEGHVVLKGEGGMNSVGLEKFYQKALKALEDGNLGSEPRRRKRRGRAAERDDTDD